MATLVAAIGFGVASGVVIALGALGFTLQFGLSNVLNIAYGAFVTMAAFLGYVLVVSWGVNVWLAMALVGIAMGALTVFYYLTLIRGLIRKRASLGSLAIATVAAGIFFEYLIVAITGPSVLSYGIQAAGTVHLWYVALPTTQAIIIVVAVALMLALHLLLTMTTLGRAMRATAVNRTLARSCGIRTERVTTTAWFISGVLAGVAGVALAMTTAAFDFTLGSTFLIVMISAAVVGGVGQPYGAMVGGLVIGLATQIGAAFWNPVYSDVIAFVLLVLMLLLRPTGLLGLQARRQDVAW